MNANTSVCLSVVIITLNEAQNLVRCLASVQGIADEIIIVDSYSTDATEQIALDFGATFFQKEWMGYAKTKNFANELASNDWILSLDADEALDDAMRNDLLKIKQHPQFQAYKITRLPNYCGHWVRHSAWNPDRKIRLFNRKIASWQGQYVHEVLKVQSDVPIGNVKGFCYHYTTETVYEQIQTLNKYSELSKNELLSKGKKATLFHLLIKPPFEFFRSYILKRGFLDGRAGLVVSLMCATDKLMRYAKMYMEQGK